jgi:hydroxyethylthiazole kinase-like uncharacterized protein yjeF
MIHVTTAQMREIDRRAIQDVGIPGVALMENAGRRVFEESTSMVTPADGTVLVLCGKGNNGGDGFVVVRHLINNGYRVEACLVGKVDEVAGDAATNLTVLQHMGVVVREIRDQTDLSAVSSRLAGAALVIDALLGTGLRGEVTGLYAGLIAAVNGTEVPVVSVDIPSGLDGDTGKPLGTAIRAVKTVTFHSPKRGFTNRSAREFLGELVVADIGIPAICADGIV